MLTLTAVRPSLPAYAKPTTVSSNKIRNSQPDLICIVAYCARVPPPPLQECPKCRMPQMLPAAAKAALQRQSPVL